MCPNAMVYWMSHSKMTGRSVHENLYGAELNKSTKRQGRELWVIHGNLYYV